jgi:hypothetical protein
VNRLNIHFQIQGITFARFLEVIPVFRKGIKEILPPASVSVFISPEAVIDGDITIQDIPLNRVEHTLKNVTTYFHQMLPEVVTTFSYVDWEHRI